MPKYLLLVFLLCILKATYCLSQPKTIRSEKVVPKKPPTNIKSGTPNPIASKQKPTLSLVDIEITASEKCELTIGGTVKRDLLKDKAVVIKLQPGKYKLHAESIDGYLYDTIFNVKAAAKIKIPIKEIIEKHTVGQSKVLNGGNAVAASTTNSDRVEIDFESDKQNDVPDNENKLSESQQKTINDLTSSMISVSGNTFLMGDKLGYNDERNIVDVTVKTFFANKYEVTQQQWESIIGTNPSMNKGCSTCPVENVSWDEVNSFIIKLNKLSNKRFRLPTEAEWEFMANLGTNGELQKNSTARKYLDNRTWYFGNAQKKTHPVGEKQQDALGIYDLFGNVAEWCSDWYRSSYADAPWEKNQKEKVIRGGSFDDMEGGFRVSGRNKLKPASKNKALGFRLVMDAN